MTPTEPEEERTVDDELELERDPDDAKDRRDDERAEQLEQTEESDGG